MIEISISGKASLEAELVALEALIDQLQIEMETARGFGDFSENHELDSARSSLDVALIRKQEVEHILKNHRLKQTYSSTSISAGTLIAVESKAADEEEWTNLGLLMFDDVGTMEFDGKISSDGPLGHAIRGMGSGEYPVLDVKGSQVLYRVKIEPESRLSEFMELYPADHSKKFQRLFGGL